MAHDFFDATPRLDVDLAKRLTEKASELQTHFGMDLSIFCEECITKTPHQLMTSWIKDCLVNFGIFEGYVTGTLEFQNTSWFRGIEPCLSELLEFYAFSLWNLSKGIYKFDDVLVSCLPELDLTSRIPYHIFKNLPEWCIYVETPNWNIHGLEPYGYFALLDCDFQAGFLLRIFLDFPSQLYQIKLPIQKSISFHDMLLHESNYVITKIMEYKTFQPYVKIAHKKRIDFNELRPLFHDPKKTKQLIQFDWLEISSEVLKFVIPQLLYLCAQNRELANVSNPQQPIMKLGLVHDKNYNGIIASYKDPSLIYVGNGAGKAISTDKEKKNICFSYIGSGTDQYLEIKHQAIRSVADVKNDEERSVNMLASLTNAMSSLLVEYEKVQFNLEKQLNENEKLTEEGLKYLEQAETLQEKLDEAQEKLSSQAAIMSQTWAGYAKKSKEAKTHDTNLGNYLKKIIILGKPLSPTECLQLVQSCWPDRVNILPTAWKSAKEIDQVFENGLKLLNLLIRLVTDYLDKFVIGGDNLAREAFTINEYAAQESETVENSKQLMNQRVFCDIPMPKHLKIGVADDVAKTARVHFSISDDKKLIIIGHCGKHLGVSSK